jgi:hypothetical protein
MRVQAVAQGFYGGETRNIGDVFDIADSDVASSAINYIANPNNVQLQGWQVNSGPMLGWMLEVPATTPLRANAPTAQCTATYPRLVF